MEGIKMKEAWHLNDKKIYFISQSLSEIEIKNLKQIAKKGTFSCPYCSAKLIVKSGEKMGNFFHTFMVKVVKFQNKVKQDTKSTKSRKKMILHDTL